ncbi:MAG: hypothetical protein WBN04_13455 [Paracoccaceae bacterium]
MTVRRVKVRYFAIVLVPISIFWINAVITDYLMAVDLNVPSDIVQDGRHWLEAAGRYRFLAATWIFSAFTVLAVALLVRSLARPTALETRAAALATIIIILLMVVVPTLQHNATPDGPRVYHRLGAEVFEAALSRGTLPGCNGPDDHWLLGRCGEIPIISLLNRILDIVNVFAALGVGALIIGMILCLETRDSDDVEQEAALLAENLRQMRQQLYLSSLTLTFGMFFATSWMYWPLPMVLDAERSAYSAVVLASALYTGTYFSLLILSFYLPVALILDGRVRKLAETAGRSAKTGARLDVNDWRDSHGLKEGAADYLRAGLAVLAPILAAFAGGISPLAL